jgi:hypothetical protein
MMRRKNPRYEVDSGRSPRSSDRLDLRDGLARRGISTRRTDASASRSRWHDTARVVGKPEPDWREGRVLGPRHNAGAVTRASEGQTRDHFGGDGSRDGRRRHIGASPRWTEGAASAVPEGRREANATLAALSAAPTEARFNREADAFTSSSPVSVSVVSAAGEGSRGEQGKRTPWTCVAETRHRARGGASRQGREKRRRRTEAGVEARDEVHTDDPTRTGEPTQRGFDQAVEDHPERPGRRSRTGKWIPRAGSVVGAWNLTGGCQEGRDGTASCPRSPDRRTDEVLEGECKTTSGRQASWVTNWTAVERKTPRSTLYALCAEAKGRRWEL